MNPLITGLHHLLIQVPDLENACREYALVLGESPSARGQSGGEPCALFALANVSLQLLQQDGPPGLVEVGFRVADAARMRRRLECLNLGFTETPTATLALPSAGAPVLAEAPALRVASSHTRGLQFCFVQGERVAADEVPGDRLQGLDHLVIRTHQSEHCAALLGARLGLDLRADLRRPEWGARLMFFRCGDLIVEVMEPLDPAGASTDATSTDSFYGLSWRAGDAGAAQQRLHEAGVAVSELRAGRKPGTRVFTLRSHCAEVPTLVIEPPAAAHSARKTSRR